MKKFWLIIFAGLLSLVLISPVLAARTDHAMPGIYNLTPFTLGNGEGSALSTDNRGQLILSPSSTIIASFPATTSFSVMTSPTPVTSTTLTYIFPSSAATLNIKNSSGRFHSMFIDNGTSTKEYIQFFDTATTPGAGATPLLTFAINGGNQMIVDASYFQFLQKYFASGIAIGISTTYKTYTASPDFASFNIMVEYD